ncbi:hypothetical protein VPH35_111760 [Triticum aestivum]
MTTLRFGSFEPASAPPKLWSDRVEADDEFEHTLPSLDSAETALRDVEPEVAPISLAIPVEVVPTLSSMTEVGLMGRGSRQVALSSSLPIQTLVSPAMSGDASDRSGSPRQVASAPPPQALAMAPSSPGMPGEEGLGQVALDSPSSSAVRRTAPTTLRSEPVGGAGGGSGQVAPAIPPLAIPAGHLSEGIWSPQLSHSREEVVAFGGIPDPVSTGRRTSARVLDLPEVDDMQQRCAMRAAKLHDAAIYTGYFPSYGTDPFMVATHSDGGQGAFGYWIYPLGDGRSGYLQPVWMAVM